MSRLRTLPFAFLVLVPACGGSDEAFIDAAPPVDSAGQPDAGPDAEVPDAAPPDGAPPASCDVPLPCPAPDVGKVSVCGQLHDAETSAPIQAASPTFLACGTDGAATDGPCQLALQLYDALDFAGNPTGAVPLPADEVVVDDCGRFRAHNVTRPALGFLGLAVDDADGAADAHRLSGTARPAASGAVLAGLRLDAVTVATDTTWTTQAGLVGDSLAERGVILATFVDGDTPVAGVTMTRNGAPVPAGTYYFSDTAPASRTTVDPEQTSTGADGAALMLGSSLVEHSGDGGERGDCAWTSGLAASIPGVVFTTTYRLEGPGGGDCP
jgi:hypothetical protein